MNREPIECARNRAHDLLAGAEAALAAGEITEAEWYARVDAVITPAYLAADNPRAQSGHSGTAEQWRLARSLILDGVDRDGSLLDVGCANGHLMECLRAWAREESGTSLEVHGLDISPRLAALARTRLPEWAGRIHTGNVMTWRPSMRYDFVRTGLEYVPLRRRPALIARLLEEVVATDGRLLIGVYNEVRDPPPDAAATIQEVTSWGFHVAGHAARAHGRDPRLRYEVLWLDAACRR